MKFTSWKTKNRGKVIRLGDDGVDEAELGSFFQTLLPALYGAHFN